MCHGGHRAAQPGQGVKPSEPTVADSCGLHCGLCCERSCVVHTPAPPTVESAATGQPDGSGLVCAAATRERGNRWGSRVQCGKPNAPASGAFDLALAAAVGGTLGSPGAPCTLTISATGPTTAG